MKIVQKIWPECVILLLILIFFGKNIFSGCGNFIGGIDVAEYFYWHARFIKNQFLYGSVPLWNPYYYCGHPFLANPQTFICYPSTLLYVILSPAWAFNLDTILHVYLAAMGSYYFVSLISQCRSAGLISAIVYGLSGYFVENILAGHLTMLHTAALLPWIFYFVEKAFKTKRKTFLALCGFVFGLQILSGEPQNCFYTIIFITIYFVIRYFQFIILSRDKTYHRYGIYYLIIPVISLGISAIQVLPSFEFMSLSDRAKNTFEFATFFSFPPQNLFTFLVPKPNTDPLILNTNWEFAGYIGIISIILAVIGGLYSKGRHYILISCVMLFIAFSIMLGHYTPLYRFYYKWIPLFSAFRIPSRCIVIFVFSMAILCGLGVCHLIESQTTKKIYATIIIVVIILLLCQLGGGRFFGISLNSKEMLLSLSMSFVSLAILTLAKIKMNNRIIVGLIITILFIDLYFSYLKTIPKLNTDLLLKEVSYESILKRDPGFYRVNSPFGTLRGMEFNYYGVNGYSPTVMKDFFKFIHEMADLPVREGKRHTLNPNLFSLDRVFSSKILGTKYAIINALSGYQMVIAKKIMPRAVIVKDAVIIPHEAQIAYIKRGDFEPEKTVLLESTIENHQLPGSNAQREMASNETVKIKNYRPNKIELKAESDTNTVLVLSELFYPGWHAYVDGKEVSILRANYILRAIPLKPGRHDISFVYEPMSFYVGATISGVTILLLGLFYCLNRRKVNCDSE